MAALTISIRKDLYRQLKPDDTGLSCFRLAAGPGLGQEIPQRLEVPLCYSRVRPSQSGAKELILGHSDMKLFT